MLLCNLSFYHSVPSTFRSLSFCDSVVLSIFCSVSCDTVTSLLCHSVTLLFHNFFSLPHCCFDSLLLVTLSPCCFAILFYHFSVSLLRHFLTLLLFHLCFFATCRSVASLIRLSFTLSLFHFDTLSPTPRSQFVQFHFAVTFTGAVQPFNSTLSPYFVFFLCLSKQHMDACRYVAVLLSHFHGSSVFAMTEVFFSCFNCFFSFNLLSPLLKATNYSCKL